MPLEPLPQTSAALRAFTSDHSLAPMLDSVRSSLAAQLVSERAYRRLRTGMRQLPDALTSIIYFEARLHDSDAIDLVIRVGEDAQSLLIGREWTGRGVAAPARHRAWNRVRDLVQVWRQGGAQEASRIHHLWLEFDLESMASANALVPGVFACFGELPTADFTPERGFQQAMAALDALSGVPCSRAVRKRVSSVFSVLPDVAYVPYVGAMLGRADESVRICVLGVPAGQLFGFFSQLESTIWVREFQSLLAHLTETQPKGPLHGAYIVHLDVAEGGVWRVGVELACARLPQVRGVLEEHALLDRLVDMGLARADKCLALREWPGAAVARVPATSRDRVVVRRLNHIKLVFRPDAPPEAKAYLAAQYFPREDLHTNAPSNRQSTRVAERTV
jgi:hypothetical protein